VLLIAQTNSISYERGTNIVRSIDFKYYFRSYLLIGAYMQKTTIENFIPDWYFS